MANLNDVLYWNGRYINIWYSEPQCCKQNIQGRKIMDRLFGLHQVLPVCVDNDGGVDMFFQELVRNCQDFSSKNDDTGCSVTNLLVLQLEAIFLTKLIKNCFKIVVICTHCFRQIVAKTSVAIFGNLSQIWLDLTWINDKKFIFATWPLERFWMGVFRGFLKFGSFFLKLSADTG